MKLRNIFATLAFAAFALVGCQKEEQKFLDEVQVSQSMVSLAVEGGSKEITVTAAADWKFAETDSWPNIIERDKDGNIKSSEPSWLTIDKTSGTAGKTVVKFSAEATTETREVLLYINCGEVSQLVNIVQMAEKVETPLTSCADVLSGAVVGKVYKVKGTVTDITNYDKYGCFYVNDGTGQVYVYGSMNSSQFAPEVGDIITFEGPWTSYGNFDDASILALEKSLIKVEKAFPAEPLPLDGGVMTVLLTVKGEGLTIEIPADAQSWLTAGEPTDLAGLTSVELTAAANEAGARNTTVTFKTVSGGKEYVAMATVEQLGAISEVTVAEFLAKEVGTSLYKLTGKVTNLKPGDYGNFHLEDATGSVYVYGLTATPVEKNDKSFPSLGIKEGDIVTLIGTRSQYANASNPAEKEQVGGPAYYVSHVGSTEVTVAEFLAKSVDSDVRYRLTGKITNLKTGDYGNFHLEDATGSVYVYGLTKAPVAKNDKSFPSLGLKEGDVVTLVGTRAQYANASNAAEKEQVGGPAYYISHVAGDEPGEDPGETPGEGGGETSSYASNVVFGTVSSAYTDGVATVNGTADVATLKLGTSSKYGEGTITLPAGTKKLSCYAVAWKGAPSKLEFSVGGTVIGTQEVAANDGAAGSPPYTITVADSDHYSVNLASPLAAETVVTVKTIETGKRVILFGVVAE